MNSHDDNSEGIDHKTSRSICDAVGEASSPLTVSNQADPANQWETHPDVDGCQQAPPPPPVIR